MNLKFKHIAHPKETKMKKQIVRYGQLISLFQYYVIPIILSSETAFKLLKGEKASKGKGMLG